MVVRYWSSSQQCNSPVDLAKLFRSAASYNVQPAVAVMATRYSIFKSEIY